MGSTCTWAARQSVVRRWPISSDSRQHMVLYLSLDKHTLEPNTSDTARGTGGTGKKMFIYRYIDKKERMKISLLEFAIQWDRQERFHLSKTVHSGTQSNHSFINKWAQDINHGSIFKNVQEARQTVEQEHNFKVKLGQHLQISFLNCFILYEPLSRVSMTVMDNRKVNNLSFQERMK